MSGSDNHGAILVVPVGLDVTRAKELPRPEFCPSVCYVITQEHDPSRQLVDKCRPQALEVANYFQKSFRSLTVVVEVPNFFDIFQVMACYRWIHQQHSTDVIFCNVGSGSKINAMAATLTSGFHQNFIAFYPKGFIASAENHVLQDTVGFLKEGILEIPSFTIDQLEPKLLTVLQFVNQQGQTVTKTELLNFLMSKEVGLIQGYSAPKGRTALKKRSDQSLFNLLKRQFIKPLKQQRLVEEREGKLSITPRGQQMLVIYTYDKFKVNNLTVD